MSAWERKAGITFNVLHHIYYAIMYLHNLCQGKYISIYNLSMYMYEFYGILVWNRFSLYIIALVGRIWQEPESSYLTMSSSELSSKFAKYITQNKGLVRVSSAGKLTRLLLKSQPKVIPGAFGFALQENCVWLSLILLSYSTVSIFCLSSL